MEKIGRIFVGLLIVAALFFGSWALWAYSVAERATTGVVERTMQPDNIIYNYEWFKTQYQQIKAYDAQIVTAATNVKNAESQPRQERDFRDKDEIARLRTIEQGLRNQRDTAIGEFNARARMANRNIFQGSDVPTQLGIDQTTDKTIPVSQ